jgi:hypothetical protein
MQINSSSNGGSVTDDNEIEFDLETRDSLFSKASNDQKYKRQQSIMDPDKPKALMDYDLDEFKNSMWENFLGSQV